MDKWPRNGYKQTRTQETSVSTPLFRLTGLSGNEIYCLHLKGFGPQGLFVGNSVQSLGLLRGVRAAFSGLVGGEVPDITRIIHDLSLIHI